MTAHLSHHSVSPLRRRMIEDMTVRNFTAATQRGYIRGVKTLADFLGRSPATATAEDLRCFQLHLTDQRNRPPMINNTVSALRFFFKVTVDRPEVTRLLTTVAQPRKMPVVLTPEEVVRFLEDAIAAYERGDYKTALMLFVPLAQQGDAEAQYKLGVMYGHGQGVAQEYSEAAKWYRKAADHGYASAQWNLATMYAEGRGLAEDLVEAAKWARRAAKQGSPDAQLFIGLTYAHGQGVVHDDAKAVEWYRKAAEQGLAEAQALLGDHYGRGHGVPQSDAEAVHWWRMAAEQGDARAQNNLGLHYALGQGILRDYVLAHLWLSLAAAQGHVNAVKVRDLIAERMTFDQLVEAKRLASEKELSARPRW